MRSKKKVFSSMLVAPSRTGALQVEVGLAQLENIVDIGENVHPSILGKSRIAIFVEF